MGPCLCVTGIEEVNNNNCGSQLFKGPVEHPSTYKALPQTQDQAAPSRPILVMPERKMLNVTHRALDFLLGAFIIQILDNEGCILINFLSLQ